MMRSNDALEVRWLRLCGLDTPDSSPHLAAAAEADFASRPLLKAMLAEELTDFMTWWHGQDVADWHLTEASGHTDWALLVLARAGGEVSESRFGLLDRPTGTVE